MRNDDDRNDDADEIRRGGRKRTTKVGGGKAVFVRCSHAIVTLVQCIVVTIMVIVGSCGILRDRFSSPCGGRNHIVVLIGTLRCSRACVVLTGAL